MCTVIVTDSASLRLLQIGKNHFGDDGVKLVVDHLHGSTTLTELRIHECGLSAKGI